MSLGALSDAASEIDTPAQVCLVFFYIFALWPGRAVAMTLFSFKLATGLSS